MNIDQMQASYVHKEIKGSNPSGKRNIDKNNILSYSIKW